MSDTIKGFRGKDGPILLDYSGVANVPGAIQSIGALTAQPGDHFEVETVDGTGRVVTVKAVAKPGGGYGQNASLSTEEKTCILRLFRNAAYKSEGMNAALTELEILWGVSTAPTLDSISATYSGGSVPVGTAVSALTGVVVTAHYSDGSTATLTGYTLSGEIAEGENTITVTYQGMTTTFVVNGYDDANTIVIVNGFLGNSSTATSAVESNPSFPNAWASTTAIAVNPGDTVTVNIDPANVNTIGNVRIRAYDTDGGYVASSSNQNGAAYNVFTPTVAGFVRIANTNTATCNPVSVVVENAAGSTTYVVSDQR